MQMSIVIFDFSSCIPPHHCIVLAWESENMDKMSLYYCDTSMNMYVRVLSGHLPW